MPPRKQPWFRFYVEAIWDRKLRRLTYAHRWLWVSLLACARSSPRPGVVLLSEGDPLRVDDIADAAAMKPAEVEKGLDLLEGLGLITQEESGAWAIIRWAERQFESDLSRALIPEDIRTVVFARDNYECVECGTGNDLTLDHITPVTKGGSDDESNLQTMCRPCNARKGNRVRQREYRSRQTSVTSNGHGNGASAETLRVVTPPENREQKTDTDSETEEKARAFSELWDRYPKRNGKKVGKGQAQTAWKRLTEAERQAALVAVIHYHDACDQGVTLAKDAHRWLTQRAFNDWQEPAQVQPTNGHQPFKNASEEDYLDTRI